MLCPHGCIAANTRSPACIHTLNKEVEGATDYKLRVDVSKTVLHSPSHIPLQEASRQARDLFYVHHILGGRTILQGRHGTDLRKVCV